MGAENLSERVGHRHWQALAGVEHRLGGGRRGNHGPRNVNEIESAQATPGQRLADGVTRALGSWRFIIVQSAVLLTWIVLNATGVVHAWDPYPFILLNLGLSFQAAYSAPIIMMSQNRQAAKDRLTAEEDYDCNVRVEWDVAAVHARLDQLAGAQWETLLAMQREQQELLGQIQSLTREVYQLTAQIEQRTSAAPPSAS